MSLPWAHFEGRRITKPDNKIVTICYFCNLETMINNVKSINNKGAPRLRDKGGTTEGIQERVAVISCIWSMKTHTHAVREGTDRNRERSPMSICEGPVCFSVLCFSTLNKQSHCTGHQGPSFCNCGPSCTAHKNYYYSLMAAPFGQWFSGLGFFFLLLCSAT